MANIVPLSELIYNSNRISKLCHSKGEPVFLTKDGFGDMVVLSMDQYEMLNARAQAYLADLKAKNIQEDQLENSAQDEASPEVSASTAADALARIGIEKLPLEDVIDILKDVLEKQQAKDPNFKKRFP